MRPIGSRALSEAGYDATTHTLRVRFRHGGVYDYLDVPEHVYDGLRRSAHPWTDWARHVRESYGYVLLDN
jgi:hypothetical protein